MAEPEELEARLTLLEARLARLESKLALPKYTGTSKSPRHPSLGESLSRATEGISQTGGEDKDSSVTSTLLGWSGATALVLAAVYLIRLAIDYGWLTPGRQIGLAVVGGLTLVGAGLALRHANRRYASLLPAGGIVTLFLSVYGAHMYYGLISPQTAAVGVVAVVVLSLWLCRVFSSEMYALFAVVGSYSVPFLIDNVLVDITDLAIYFSAWSIVFGVYAIWVGHRLVYLLALYCALLGLDSIWRSSMQDEWMAALVFQTLQFAIFAVTTAAFSIRRGEPMTRELTAAHLPALLIFYFLQYALLKQHLPEHAPWIALSTAAALAGLYLATQHWIHKPMPGGRFLLSTYAALVLFHAGYLESVPDEWAPWVAFVLVPAVALYSLTRMQGQGVNWPVWLGVGVIGVINYLRIIFDADTEQVPGGDLLPLLYAMELYAGYWFVQGKEQMKSLHIPLLYAGHISAMAAAGQLLDDRLATSMAWGLLAIGCLALAIRWRERILGQSSLLIFAAFAGKVMLYDMQRAAPLVRIGILLVLGLSLYAGGWLYQRMISSKTETC